MKPLRSLIVVTTALLIPYLAPAAFAEANQCFGAAPTIVGTTVMIS